jgi:hypothetical protein
MTTTGVVGARWRATVTPWGAVEPWDGSPPLDWAVAADDRWHRPAAETTVRQALIEHTPVVETRVRVPSGDVLQRVYSVADNGGCTVVEVSNESPLPVAVAFTRPDLMTSRTIADVPIEGVDLPANSIVMPVGHHATIAVALSHTGRTGALASLPTAQQVARGWTHQLDRAGRLVTPGVDTVATLARARAELLLNGPSDHDPAELVAGIAVLRRLGEPSARWTEEMGGAVEALGAHVRRSGATVGDRQAMWAAAQFFHAAGERRAVADTLQMIRATAASGDDRRPAGGASLALWLESLFVATDAVATATLMRRGFEADQLGANVEVYSLPAGLGAETSFAVRWHGARPAVLWETVGDSCGLRGPGGWSTEDEQGEALWSAPDV